MTDRKDTHVFGIPGFRPVAPIEDVDATDIEMKAYPNFFRRKSPVHQEPIHTQDAPAPSLSKRVEDHSQVVESPSSPKDTSGQQGASFPKREFFLVGGKVLTGKLSGKKNNVR
jgi:hypothetical protein